MKRRRPVQQRLRNRRRHGDPFRFFIAQEDISPHLLATDMVVLIPRAPSGRYDALKFIDNADTRESVHQTWDDDVFQVPG